MQAIEYPFNGKDLSQLENLTLVAGYLRGKPFNVEIHEPGIIPKPVLTYIHQLQEIHRLVDEPDMSNAVVDLLNRLWIEAKYKDKEYLTTLHLWLIALGYVISSEEKDRFFGASTREAIQQFQRKNKLPLTEWMDLATEQALVAAYSAIGRSDSGVHSEQLYFLKGEAFDANWQPLKGTIVKVWEKRLRSAEVLLGSGSIDDKGYFEVAYSPPLDKTTNAPKEPIHLLVQLEDREGTSLYQEILFHVKETTWLYFTQGERPYAGISVYTETKNTIQEHLDGLPVLSLEESDQHQDITYLHAQTGLDKATIMQFYLAERVAREFESYKLPASVFFAFFKQHVPQNLPSYLLPDEPAEWTTWVNALVKTQTLAVALLPRHVQQSALERAASANLLPLEQQQQQKTHLATFDTIRLAYAKTAPLIGKQLSLQDILEQTSIETKQQPRIIERFAQEGQFNGILIENLYEDALINKKQRGELRREAQLIQLGGKDATKVRQLREAFNAEGYSQRITRVSDFAKWTIEDWTIFDPKQAKQIIGGLAQQAVALAPSVATLAALQRNHKHGLSHVKELTALLDEQQLLHLGQVPIDTVLKERNIELSKTAVEELKRIQRVEHLAPEPKLVPQLLAANIHSAYQVQQMGAMDVAQIYVRGGMESELATLYGTQTYQTAQQTLATLVGLSASQGLLDGGGVTPAAITPLPNLEDLFGSNDFCGCAHCRSVYSPAAYLTDLLQWLKNKKTDELSSSGLQILLARRPDLEHILLNCKNANTPMPYIDLVNEVLEYALMPTPSYEKRNTTWRAAELKAQPEHQLHAIYERFIALPGTSNYRPYASYNGLNIWQSQVHLYLEKAGTTSAQLMQLLETGTTNALAKAAASFKIPSHELLAITTPNADVNALANTSSNVAKLLHHHQLSYEQLMAILQCKFLNPSGGLKLQPSNVCNLDAQSIFGMTSADRDKWWRFLRLWKYTDWSIWELDQLIVHPKIGNGVLDAACMERLAQFLRLQQRMGYSVNQMLAFWGNLDTRQRLNAKGEVVSSFYETIYYGRLLDATVRPNFSLGAFNVNLNSITPQVTAYLADALATTSETIVLYLTYPQPGHWSSVMADRVRMAAPMTGLSLLYAYQLLGQYLQLSPTNLKHYLTFSATLANPFNGLDDLEAFLDQYQVFHQSGLSFRETAYLLINQNGGDYLTSTKIDQWQETLYRQLGEAYDAAMISRKTERETLAFLLEKAGGFDGQEAIADFLDIIYGTDNLSTADRTTYINNLSAPSPIDYADGAAIDELKQQLLNNQLTNGIATLKMILHRRLHSPLVMAYLADLWDVSLDVVTYLLADEHPVLGRVARHVLMEPVPSGFSMTPMVPISIGPSLPTPPPPPSLSTVYRRLHKYLFLTHTFQLSVDDLKQWEAATTSLSLLELGTLLVGTGSGTVATTLDRWLHTAQLLQFAREQGMAVGDLIRLIDRFQANSNVNDFFEGLIELTKWEIAPNELMGWHLHRGYAASDYVSNWGIWSRLCTIAQLQQHLGTPIQTLLRWNSTLYDTSSPQYVSNQYLVAREVHNTLREVVPDSQWLPTQQAIQDQLRLQKRDALLAYARNYDAQGNALRRSDSDLYHYYLIDPQMSACQLTSRIKQAISAVQLFVQRCRMGLERDFLQVKEEQGWSEWEWMQSYRVWEANRKVFLYPENWIEPSLRDNKSELFQQFEEELLQRAITPENVENALQSYLVRLNEIASLEMMSMAREGLTGTGTTHVLARTKEHPAIYYYRKMDDLSRTWTGWEKLPLDIQDEHPVLQVYNGKLHLFWLQIVERPEQMVTTHKEDPVGSSTGQTDSTKNTTKVLPNYKEIQLVWSVLRKEGWAAQKVSKRKLIHPWPRPNYSLHLRPRFKENDLWIDLFVSPSPEFNNQPFYNQFTNSYQRMVRPSSTYNKTMKPWHSSSFVFDGFVRAVKLFAIDGTYWVKRVIGVKEMENQPVGDDTKPIWFDHIIKSVRRGKTWYLTTHGSFEHQDVQELATLINRINATPLFDNTGLNLIDISTRYVAGQGDLLLFMIDFGNGIIMPVENTLNDWNNLLADNDANTSNTRPTVLKPVWTGNYLPNQYTETHRKENTNSYQYIYHSYGEDGRLMEELTINEHMGELDQLGGFTYYNNLLTTGPVQTGPNLLSFGSSPSLFYPKVAFPEQLQVTFPLERTSNKIELTHDFSIQAKDRAFYVKSVPIINPDPINHWFYTGLSTTGYRLFHPFAREFSKALGSQGIKGLYNRGMQQLTTEQDANDYILFWGTFDEGKDDNISFKLSDGYGLYNWEIFFHIPFLIATELSKNQQFEEAMAWFHCVFNPMGIDEADGTPPPSDVSRYWITRPFYEHTESDYLAQQIQNLLSGTLSEDTQRAIAYWKKHPFRPHAVARMRPVAYQKAIVMKYIDNLLAWGDQLFRRETLESINQAGLMYMLAAELLGDRPQKITGQTPDDKDYDTLGDQLDTFSNASVALPVENLAVLYQPTYTPFSEWDSNQLSSVARIQYAQYFCIPHNEKLTGYWDLVEDRLFKIRHCMDIDGRIRQLPLFAPPIDPALLVNATANGVDLSSVLSDLATPKPHYKYRPLARLASQFTAEVKALGQSLLSALQSRDAEGMALLQAGNALKVLDAGIALKTLQIEEAKENIQSLELSKVAAEFRQTFYKEREYMNGGEKESMKLNKGALVLNGVSAAVQIIATALMPIPKIEASVGLAAAIKTEIIDGQKLANLFSLARTILDQSSGILSRKAGLVATQASYDRRQEEWDFQAELAERDIQQIDQQIAAAKVRLAIAERDLNNHKLQIDNARTEEAYLQSKYTNQQLYSWMVGQLSTTYFQAYQLAFDLARRAEKSLRYELAVPTDAPTLIQFGYWDSLHKGLLSGDKLMLALNKMEARYVELNQRELELTKHISLHQWAPNALLQLKTTGKCLFNIPEWWFDLDYPGHYLRRTKAITLSIPCIVGPNVNINCTATLSSHKLRPDAAKNSTTYQDANQYDEFFELQSIATSSGQNDGGVFELNFNDERYLPFEGTGAISTWELRLPEVAQFDYQSITDVVMHMRYTARDGGSTAAIAAKPSVQNQLSNAAAQEPNSLLFSAKEAFPTAWHRFKQTATGTAPKLDLTIALEHYPYFVSKMGTREVVAGTVGVLQADNSGASYTGIRLSINDTATSQIANLTIGAGATYGALALSDFGISSAQPDMAKWSVELPVGTDLTAIDDLYLLLVYTTS